MIDTIMHSIGAIITVLSLSCGTILWLDDKYNEAIYPMLLAIFMIIVMK